MKKGKFRGGGRLNIYGILRGWGVTHFGISEGKGVKILKQCVIVYGYFLELPYTV